MSNIKIKLNYDKTTYNIFDVYDGDECVGSFREEDYAKEYAKFLAGEDVELENTDGKCLVCGMMVKNHDIGDSNRTRISFGYGSRHDTDIYDIYLCDDCVVRKVEEKLLKPIRVNLVMENL